MDSKRLKIDALAETRKRHPFQFTSGKTAGKAEEDTTTLKMGALAKARQLIVDHPVQFKSGKIYIALPTIDRAPGPAIMTSPIDQAPGPAIMPSPSGIPMRVVDRSRRNRTAEQMDEQIEASRQHHILLHSECRRSSTTRCFQINRTILGLQSPLRSLRQGVVERFIRRPP